MPTELMHFYKLELNTMRDIKDFVDIATTIEEPLMLTDGEGYTVSAKSLMGAIYALEWNELYLTSKSDIYFAFQKYIKSSTIRYI